MKRNGSWLILAALCLLLTGCGETARQPDPTPTPVITPRPTPTPRPTLPPTPTPVPTAPTLQDPDAYLSSWLDYVLAGTRTLVRFWQHPGSGPSPMEPLTAECGPLIRALFEELDWEQTEEPDYADMEEAPPGFYQVSIYYLDDETKTLGRDGWIGLEMGRQVIMLGTRGPDSVYLRADGAEKLCDALADLMPSVYINLGRTTVPPQESREATVRLYLLTALERTKALGHITDYELRAYAALPEEEDSGEKAAEEGSEPPGIRYTATYAVKPADPAADYWLAWTVDADGWIVNEIDCEVLGYDAGNGCYRMV